MDAASQGDLGASGSRRVAGGRGHRDQPFPPGPDGRRRLRLRARVDRRPGARRQVPGVRVLLALHVRGRREPRRGVRGPARAQRSGCGDLRGRDGAGGRPDPGRRDLRGGQRRPRRLPRRPVRDRGGHRDGALRDPLVDRCLPRHGTRRRHDAGRVRALDADRRPRRDTGPGLAGRWRPGPERPGRVGPARGRAAGLHAGTAGAGRAQEPLAGRARPPGGPPGAQGQAERGPLRLPAGVRHLRGSGPALARPGRCAPRAARPHPRGHGRDRDDLGDLRPVARPGPRPAVPAGRLPGDVRHGARRHRRLPPRDQPRPLGLGNRGEEEPGGDASCATGACSTPPSQSRSSSACSSPTRPCSSASPRPPRSCWRRCGT